MMRVLISLVGLIFISSCALPTSEVLDQDFIPEEELEIVSLVREGLDYFKRGRYVDSQFAFLRANYLAPDADNIKLNLAMAFREQGNLDDAEQILRKLLEVDPKSTIYLSGLGGVYLERLDFKKAKELYDEAYLIAEERADVGLQVATLKTLTVLSFRSGATEQARCYAQQAYELSKDLESTINYLRILLSESEQGQSQELISEYRKSVPGTDARVLYLQAMTLFLEGALEDIIRLRRDIRFAPSFELIKTEYALLEVVTIKLLEEEGRLGSVSEYLPQGDEDEDEDEEDPLLSLYGGKALEIAERLFWPSEYLHQLERLINEAYLEAGIDPSELEAGTNSEF